MGLSRGLGLGLNTYTGGPFAPSAPKHRQIRSDPIRSDQIRLRGRLHPKWALCVILPDLHAVADSSITQNYTRINDCETRHDLPCSNLTHDELASFEIQSDE